MCLLYTLSMRHTQTHTPSHTHTNSHRVSSKIYNIHNYLLKQNRLFFSHPGYMTRQANTACRFIIFDQKKGRLSLFICVFLSFFFSFLLTKEWRTRTRNDIHYNDQRNVGIARICYRFFMPVLPRQSKDYTSTDRKQLCCYLCSENCITIVFSCCTIAI